MGGDAVGTGSGKVLRTIRERTTSGDLSVEYVTHMVDKLDPAAEAAWRRVWSWLLAPPDEDEDRGERTSEAASDTADLDDKG